MKLQKQFKDIIELIKLSRFAAIKAINTELITLYWNIGEYISQRVESAEWGQSIVLEPANYIQQNEPDVKGFSDKNLWRMKQFYEAYIETPNLSPLVREISCTNNLTILSRAKSNEEKELLQPKLHELFKNINESG